MMSPPPVVIFSRAIPCRTTFRLHTLVGQKCVSPLFLRRVSDHSNRGTNSEIEFTTSCSFWLAHVDRAQTESTIHPGYEGRHDEPCDSFNVPGTQPG
jgi:hypothetical protein